MAEDAENNAEVKDEVARNTNLAEDAVEEEAKKPANILEQLFSRGNRLLTLPGSSLVINDDTRRLLA